MVKKVSPTPRPPSHLSEPAKRWWRSVLDAYELEPHHLLLLAKAAEAWDRAEQARQFLDANGLTYQDRFSQPKVRPEVAIERDCRIGFARLVRELCLDIEAPDGGRPPRRGGRK